MDSEEPPRRGGKVTVHIDTESGPGIRIGPEDEPDDSSREAKRGWRDELMLIAAVLSVLLGSVTFWLDLPGKWQSWSQARAAATSSAISAPVLQTLSGEILDAETGMPLPGAEVAATEHGVTAKTGSDGRFALELKAARETFVRLRISANGYQVKNETPMLIDGQFETYRLRLE